MEVIVQPVVSLQWLHERRVSHDPRIARTELTHFHGQRAAGDVEDAQALPTRAGGGEIGRSLPLIHSDRGQQLRAIVDREWRTGGEIIGRPTAAYLEIRAGGHAEGPGGRGRRARAGITRGIAVSQHASRLRRPSATQAEIGAAGVLGQRRPAAPGYSQEFRPPQAD